MVPIPTRGGGALIRVNCVPRRAIGPQPERGTLTAIDPQKVTFLSSREAGVVRRVALRGHQRYLWKVKYVWV